MGNIFELYCELRFWKKNQTRLYLNRYTYGKPVEGTVTLRAKNEHWYRPWNYHGDEPMIEQSLTLVRFFKIEQLNLIT